ncbi:cupredoxin domain-containing protein [Methanobacterium sp. SMA-27]|uniref:cupredoxin domain-containing protein n=1 Tax=Methanobacterium sp. SMA-27 TaxID=1495336 RepID=UPI0006944ECA|nr:cupredoxin domain-containing protein [Methanobacterium sp. SMA-27]
MKRNLSVWIVLSILFVVGISGCTFKQPTNDTVVIQNEGFSPSALIVPVNTTVTWINKDPVTQNLVSDTGLFESGNLSNGQSFNYTFNQTGSYHYYSNLYPNMKGSIIVTTSPLTGI